MYMPCRGMSTKYATFPYLYIIKVKNTKKLYKFSLTDYFSLKHAYICITSFNKYFSTKALSTLLCIFRQECKVYRQSLPIMTSAQPLRI